MALVPLEIPPGVFRNGTDLQVSGRWIDCNLIRWKDGVMRPIGGWVSKGTVSGIVRGAFAWKTNIGEKWAAFGTADGLHVMGAGYGVSDISPVDLAAGSVGQSGAFGYGAGPYGEEAYGTPHTVSGLVTPATTWAMDNWGENLIAVSSADKRILEWSLTGDAAPVTGAPNCDSAMVTQERFLFALGADGDPRKVAWSDREDNTEWTPASTNEAGDFTLQTTGRIMAGLRAKQQSLILTDQDAFSVTYINPPYVHRFDQVGTSCGLIAPLAAASVDSGVIWMGQRSFYAYRDGSVMQIPCDVADYVFSDINYMQASKIAAVSNQGWSEIWWLYPSEGSTECDRYVVYNYADNLWYFGQIDRTAGFDAGAWAKPVMVAADGTVYEHETAYSHGADIPFAESGPISMGAGDVTFSALSLIPDERTQGDVQARFKTRFYPQGPEAVFGPYQMSNPTDVRFTGRQARMRVEGVRNTDWRVGTMRLDVVKRGRK